MPCGNKYGNRTRAAFISGVETVNKTVNCFHSSLKKLYQQKIMRNTYKTTVI